MKIKEVKMPKNKEALKKEITEKKKCLILGRTLVGLGIPSMVTSLGLSLGVLTQNITNISESYSNESFEVFVVSIIGLGLATHLHYLNQDASYELHMMEDQLSKMEKEQEDAEIKRILRK